MGCQSRIPNQLYHVPGHCLNVALLHQEAGFTVDDYILDLGMALCSPLGGRLSPPPGQRQGVLAWG
jgi:hypothetical protein